MKLLIIVVSIFAVANANEQLKKLKETVLQMLSECKDTVGGSAVDIDQFVHRITPDSAAGKCMIACLNKKIKIQDQNGKIDPDSTRQAAELIKGIDEKWYKILLNVNEKCIKEVDGGTDECDIAARWFTCVNKAESDAGLPMILADD